MVEIPVFLRSVIDADVPYFFEHSQDTEAICMAAPADVESEWPEFARKWDHIRSSEVFHCRTVIWDKEVAGYIAKFPQMEVPSVSYWYARRLWGRGLAREALRLFLIQATDRPIHARVALDNAASLRALAANGFETVSKGSYFSAALGRDVDELVLRLDN